jgi:hypothetical protein
MTLLLNLAFPLSLAVALALIGAAAIAQTANTPPVIPPQTQTQLIDPSSTTAGHQAAAAVGTGNRTTTSAQTDVEGNPIDPTLILPPPEGQP